MTALTARTGTVRQGRGTALWLLLPSLVLLVIAYLIPLVVVIRMAFSVPSASGLPHGGFTLGSMTQAFTDPYYWQVIGTTLLISVLVALFTTVVAYPIALLLVSVRPATSNLLMALAIAPMLTSSVARTFGWTIMLGNKGVVNALLGVFGLGPIPFMGSIGGIVIALVEIYVPYAVLTMTSGFGRVSGQLKVAAQTLGARPWTAFRRITLPLSMPGVAVAFMLVFVLSLSAYVTPRIMGGGRIFVLATEIYNEATVTVNWPMAASLSVLLFALFGVLTLLIALVRRVLSLSGSHVAEEER
ncbi:ABC transporter permease [Pseudoclavibacter sp. CFCC 13611]|uniref:ABC transporter permease n=1 Tax=Pseudoclavibacter sp. CFCC 13611 TaxID=2615178 RepID=UPI0013015C3F|nr:ABC transporter permease [Pseudoclavibacter sp. CFCC 13611]KAB1664191.1 ABC transporter permease [Pseudoclavibacter sp. CFCC 13611]